MGLWWGGKDAVVMEVTHRPDNRHGGGGGGGEEGLICATTPAHSILSPLAVQLPSF